MTRADLLERAQRRSLDDLRTDDETRGVLDELTRASCLLELAKLSSGRLDLVSWSQAVVETVPQFFAVTALRLRVALAGMPPVDAAYGGPGGGEPVVHPISDGTLEVAGPCAADPFFALAAQQLAAQLATVVETERLRRRAAGAEALAVAATLEDIRGTECLQKLADALSAMPAAIGASITITHRLVGGSLVVRAGAPGADRTHRFDLVGGEVTVAIVFAAPPTPEDERPLLEVLDAVVAAIQRAEEKLKLREEAETDPLTGCGNRRVASRTLAVASSRARTLDEALAVLALDLDHFKRVNDDLGHMTGDAVLQAFATGLTAAVREWDVVCRMGGEEFLVICPDTDRQAALGLAARVLHGTPSWCDDVLPGDRCQTVSIGIATFPAPATTVDELLRGSDHALYQAKIAGRSAARVFGD